jgi:phthiocerol/phenolphthiocerol synthesis type-I polyketide synthase C
MELRNCLEASLGLTLKVVLMFAYPTVSKLADYLLRELGLAPEGAAAAEPAAPKRTARAVDESELDDLATDVMAEMLSARLDALDADSDGT